MEAQGRRRWPGNILAKSQSHDCPALLCGSRYKGYLKFSRRQRMRHISLTSSNTSLSLYWVSAEHSTYFTAPRSFAIRSPSSFRTGCILCFASFSRTLGSSRRSVCVPTIRQGTPGQWWCTSGNHFSRTFSNDAGDVTLKHTRNTSVWGYDNGRRRS